MADRGFLAKSQSSLVKRILFVCMFLLVVPLIVDSLLVYVHEFQTRMRTFYISLDVVALGQQNLIDEIVKEKIEKMSAPNSKEGELLPRTSPEWEVAHRNGKAIFVGQDPDNGQKKIYIAEAINKGEVRVIGVPAVEFVSTLTRLPGRPFDFHMGILLPDGSLFIADDPEVSFNDVEYLETPYHDINFFYALWKKPAKIGLKKPWKGTDLSLSFIVSTEAIRSASAFSWLSNFLLIFFAVFILGFILTYFITRRMAKPLYSLCREMDKVGKGDLTARYTQDLFGLEINTLGSSFNQMIDSLVEQIEISKNERIAKEALETELKIGQKIQKSLLPTRLVAFPGLDIGAGFQAALEVAGDFYDLFVANHRLMIAVGDASGKGISACLYSLGVRSLLRSFNLCYPDNLAKALDATNAIFCKDTEDTQHFVTAWVGIFDPETLLLEYGSAGHPAAILKRKDQEILELFTPGIALGALETESNQTKTIQLISGDCLILYSDGITEAHNLRGELYGKARLIEFIKNLSFHLSAQQMVDDLFKDVEGFSVNTSQYDDLTLLIIKLLQPEF